MLAGLIPDHRATLNTLAPGDEVALEWRHEYVTMEYDGGGSSSCPQRKITHLAKR